jgi:hypothetical protein
MKRVVSKILHNALMFWLKHICLFLIKFDAFSFYAVLCTVKVDDVFKICDSTNITLNQQSLSSTKNLQMIDCQFVV